MSVKILYLDGKEREYSENEDLISQLDNASTVEIGIDNPEKANNFLSAVCDIPSYIILPPVTIKVNHQDTIVGAKLARKAKSISKRTAFAWLVKEIIKNQANLESKLSDIIMEIHAVGDAIKSGEAIKNA